MDELLFYAGIAAAVVSVAAGVIIFIVYRSRMRRLERTLDAEYGARRENKGRKRSGE